MKRLKFSAMDTLFFREARPMESVGGKPLQGRFPPTARTVAGAVRGVIGEAMNVDWHAYRKGDDASQQAVRDIIGAADKEGIGVLDLRGAYPMQGDERLYPAPLHVLHHEGENKYVRLQPGGAVTCDLGKVYLPEMLSSLPGAKPLENCWLTAADLVRVLSGGEPEKVIQQKDLFQAEARLGIALDSGTRRAQEGKLYQTVHARVQDEVCIGVDVTGIPADLGIEQVLRLGGEGRFAHVQTGTATMLPPATLNKDAHGLLLMLCSAAEFSGDWLLPGFAVTTDAQGATVWRGTIAGVELTIQCAVLGKSQREGGWDLQKHQSRPAVSLIPAGTCPAVLQRYKRDAERMGKQINFDVPPNPGEMQALASTAGPVFLEEYRFKVEENNLDDIIQALAQVSGVAGFAEALKKQLMILNDDDFSYLAKHAVPVTPHIALDSETKSVKGGALWYEETLPPETLLYVCLAANDARKKDSVLSADAVLKTLQDIFTSKPYLQLGGNETVGMGWCKVRVGA